jgi:uncharacterized protein DUF1206
VSAGRDLARRAEKALAPPRQRATPVLARLRPLHWLIRAGFVARAVTYGVIGALALAIALGAGTSGTAANQQGALSLIASADVGRPALVVLCAGLLAYALWKLAQGIFGRGPEGGGSAELKDRVGNAAGGLVYVGFFAVGVSVLTRTAGNSAREPGQTTSGVMGWPGGQVLVGIAGAGLIAISLYQLYDGLRGGFLEEAKAEQLDDGPRRLFLVLGRVGLSARAMVFALIGYFLLRTAIEYDSRQAIGVDGALARLHDQPLGPLSVGLVGVGLLIFAAFSLFEARYRRL